MQYSPIADELDESSDLTYLDRPLDDDDPTRARHRTSMALHNMAADDPEPMYGRKMRSGRKTKTVNHAKGRLERTAKGSPKVRKAQFWKRRNLVRLARVKLERRIREAA